MFGSFGYGNAGDEAAWMAVNDLAERAGISGGVDVVTRFDEPWSDSVLGLGEKYSDQRKALSGQPLLIVGGGVIENSDYCVLLRAQKLLKELIVPRVALLGVNADSGVRYGWRLKRSLRRALAKADFVSVRDYLSQTSCEFLCPKRSVEVTGDIVLCMKPGETVPAEVEDLEGFIAVTLAPRWSSEPEWREWITNELAQTARQLQMPLVFVPCCTRFDDDRTEHAAVVAALRSVAPEVRTLELTSHMDARQVSAVLARANLAVGMRLHACVMAVANGVPCVGLAYHPKLHGLARTLGCQEHFLPRTVPAGRRNVEFAGYSFAESGIHEEKLAEIAESAIQNLSLSLEHVDRLRSKIEAAFRCAVGLG